MFASISRRPACALAAGTFGLLISVAPALAHVAGPPAHSSLRAFNRFDFNRHAFNRFGHHRFNRIGRNQLGLADWGYSGGPWDYSGGQPPAPIIVGGGGPPVSINLYTGAGGGEIGGGYTGGCVIHKLLYDRAGKFVGERQIPAC